MEIERAPEGEGRLEDVPGDVAMTARGDTEGAGMIMCLAFRNDGDEGWSWKGMLLSEREVHQLTAELIRWSLEHKK